MEMEEGGKKVGGSTLSFLQAKRLFKVFFPNHAISNLKTTVAREKLSTDLISLELLEIL
jgi:hypothetical protein